MKGYRGSTGEESSSLRVSAFDHHHLNEEKLVQVDFSVGLPLSSEDMSLGSTNLEASAKFV